MARIRFRHPPLNIFSIEFLRGLRDAIRSLKNDPEILVVIFCSNLPKAFSAGVAIQDHYPNRAPLLFKMFHDIFRTLWTWDKLSVAEVNGYCLGGGAELAFSCDLAVATSTTVFGFPEIIVGAFPPIAILKLPPTIGFPQSVELILTGRRFTSQEALHWGLLNRRCRGQDLIRTTSQLLDLILKQSTKVVKETIAMMRIHTQPLVPLVGEAERHYLRRLLKTHDAIEGLNAFFQKRSPQWLGK